MADKQQPSNGLGADTPGLPHYEKSRQRLKELLQQRRNLERQLQNREEAISTKEADYLENTPSGNIITGFDNYIKGTAGAASQRRKTGQTEANRVFSRSSISYGADSNSSNGAHNNSSGSGSGNNSSAPTPLQTSFKEGGGSGSASGSGQGTPTSVTAASRAGHSKKKKSGGAAAAAAAAAAASTQGDDDDDSETDSREIKKVRTSFGAVRK